MALTDDDVEMAVRDFFTPALLKEFIDLSDRLARIRWGARQFKDSSAPRSVRRLAGEPDAGCLTRWKHAPSGFVYEVEARTGVRSGLVTWDDVHKVVEARLTPVRYGALRAAVEAAAAHEAAYVPCPGPFRSVEIWESEFHRTWARRSSELALRASAALDAVCPAAVAQPALF
ncbi:hypothetical protein ACQF36_22365 [Streptomyces sp. Marseille-Q5077]|uniref:hypothetical protein n=1 Tax=Streptomyces sp. Marseille-Q5077 TaxID=3418995 RepID=UPI003D074190